MGNKKASKGRRGTSSGAVGGPGTGSGLGFQVDFAVRHALEAISRALADPIADFRISMEPRVVTGERDVTCWDVRLTHPERVTEVKLRPKRADIEEWLDRVNLGVRQNADLRFELSYGRGASPLITAIESLCRIATEADGSIDRFRALVSLEHSPAFEAVLGCLDGGTPRFTLAGSRETHRSGEPRRGDPIQATLYGACAGSDTSV